MSSRMTALLLACAAAGFMLAPAKSNAYVDLWPIIELSEDTTTVFYPFFVREGPFIMVFPVYYRTNEGKDHHLVWPLVKVSEGKLKRLAPVWFSGVEDDYTLFPLIRQTKDYTFWSLPPTYLKNDKSMMLAFPFFYKSKDFLWVAPTLCVAKSPDGTFTQEIEMFPFFDHTKKDAEGRSHAWQILVLLGWEVKDLPDSKGLDKSAFLIPFYYSRKAPESRQLWVMPYYRDRSANLKEDMLFPFFGYSNATLPAPDAHKMADLPQPPTWTETDLWFLGGLYHRVARYDSYGEIAYRYRRFLIFSDKTEADGTRTFSFLGIPYRERMTKKSP